MAIEESILWYKIHLENQKHNKNESKVIGTGKRKEEA